MATVSESVFTIIKDSVDFEDPILPTHRLRDDLGMDDLDITEVVMDCEEFFDIEIDTEADELETVEDLINCVTDSGAV